MINSSEYYIRIFSNRSELVFLDGSETVFLEGVNNALTKDRYQKIVNMLKSGYLVEQIRICCEEPQNILSDNLNDQDTNLLDALVDSITSEVGRALIGLSVLQLTIKSIVPDQSIRLHKGSNSKSSFGWESGISMRSLDKKFITPVLRNEELVKLNADGFMMTRSLAENYPYTKVYKASIRGARLEWLTMVERLEASGGALPALPALHYLLSKLLNHSKLFEDLALNVFTILNSLLDQSRFNTVEEVKSVLKRHMIEANYSARIMEISMHSFMQAIEEFEGFGGASLVPLSQMRSANKKHGNIGDIELVEDREIIVSWDAKYGKNYLRDELEELKDKLNFHDSVLEAGFVTSEDPVYSSDVTQAIIDIEDLFDIKIYILTLDEWIDKYLNIAIEFPGVRESEIARNWIIAYAESIAQKRVEKAPIDEPCYEWLYTFRGILQEFS